jgi:hypothetical protein
MRFYAFLWARPSPFSCLNSSNCVLPTIATISTDATKARVHCLRKILLNSWSYGARLVADHLFDSMSSVVGDRAVAQADHSLSRCDGRNWRQCCYEVVTTTGAMWAIGTVEERVKIKLLNIYDAPFIRVDYFFSARISHGLWSQNHCLLAKLNSLNQPQQAKARTAQKSRNLTEKVRRLQDICR